MKDLKVAIKEKLVKAMEIGIKNCIGKKTKGQKVAVNISQADSKTLYSMYRAYVEDDDKKAMSAIGYTSRHAAAPVSLTPYIFFEVALLLVLYMAFHNLWFIFFALIVSAIVFYIIWKPRRLAQKIWANRKALKRGTEEALEKMCLVLSQPLRYVSYPVLGGLTAAALVCLYQMILVLIG